MAGAGRQLRKCDWWTMKTSSAEKTHLDPLKLMEPGVFIAMIYVVVVWLGVGGGGWHYVGQDWRDCWSSQNGLASRNLQICIQPKKEHTSIHTKSRYTSPPLWAAVVLVSPPAPPCLPSIGAGILLQMSLGPSWNGGKFRDQMKSGLGRLCNGMVCRSDPNQAFLYYIYIINNYQTKNLWGTQKSGLL